MSSATENAETEAMEEDEAGGGGGDEAAESKGSEGATPVVPNAQPEEGIAQAVPDSTPRVTSTNLPSLPFHKEAPIGQETNKMDVDPEPKSTGHPTSQTGKPSKFFTEPATEPPVKTNTSKTGKPTSGKFFTEEDVPGTGGAEGITKIPISVTAKPKPGPQLKSFTVGPMEAGGKYFTILGHQRTLEKLNSRCKNKSPATPKGGRIYCDQLAPQTDKGPNPHHIHYALPAKHRFPDRSLFFNSIQVSAKLVLQEGDEILMSEQEMRFEEDHWTPRKITFPDNTKAQFGAIGLTVPRLGTSIDDTTEWTKENLVVALAVESIEAGELREDGSPADRLHRNAGKVEFAENSKSHRRLKLLPGMTIYIRRLNFGPGYPGPLSKDIMGKIQGYHVLHAQEGRHVYGLSASTPKHLTWGESIVNTKSPLLTSTQVMIMTEMESAIQTAEEHMQAMEKTTKPTPCTFQLDWATEEPSVKIKMEVAKDWLEALQKSASLTIEIQEGWPELEVTPGTIPEPSDDGMVEFDAALSPHSYEAFVNILANQSDATAYGTHFAGIISVGKDDRVRKADWHAEHLVPRVSGRAARAKQGPNLILRQALAISLVPREKNGELHGLLQDRELFPEFTKGQARALGQMANEAPVTLVVGVPGCGKSYTVFLGLLNISLRNPDTCFVVTAQNNSTCCSLYERLKELNTKVGEKYPELKKTLISARVASYNYRTKNKNKENVHDQAEAMQHKITELEAEGPEAQDLLNACKAVEEYEEALLELFQGKEDEEYPKALGKTHKALTAAKETRLAAYLKYKKVNVIVTTVDNAAFFTLKKLGIQATHLVVDEASQQRALDVAWLVGQQASTLRKLILCGDPNQLGAYTQLPGGARDIASTSVLDALGKDCKRPIRIPPALLTTVHRCHPDLVRYIRPMYEERTLHTKQKSDFMADVAKGLPLPHQNGTARAMFLVVEHQDQKEGRSSFNTAELELTAKLVDFIDATKPKDKEMSILVISAYKAQGDRLKSRLGAKATVGTHNEVIGKEADVTIVNLTKCGAGRNRAGFMTDRRKLSVITSRAKAAMFIIGSIETFMEVAEEMEKTKGEEDAGLAKLLRRLGADRRMYIHFDLVLRNPERFKEHPEEYYHEDGSLMLPGQGDERTLILAGQGTTPFRALVPVEPEVPEEETDTEEPMSLEEETAIATAKRKAAEDSRSRDQSLNRQPKKPSREWPKPGTQRQAEWSRPPQPGSQRPWGPPTSRHQEPETSRRGQPPTWPKPSPQRPPHNQPAYPGTSSASPVEVGYIGGAQAPPTVWPIHSTAKKSQVSDFIPAALLEPTGEPKTGATVETEASKEPGKRKDNSKGEKPKEEWKRQSKRKGKK